MVRRYKSEYNLDSEINKEKNKRMIVLVTFIIIFQISTLFLCVFLYLQVNSLDKQLNQTSTDFQKQLLDSKIETQANINTLSEELITTKKDITEIKATASDDFSAVIEKSIKSVVAIKTDVAQGSGFIISENGLVVTNAHVLTNAHYARVLTNDNLLLNSELVGYDLDLDVAVLEIPGTYSYLEFANSNDVKVGEKVIALGNPLGLSFSATEGIVSATDRPGTNNLPIYIQTDVPLNPGNSGGPLINKQGKVIGINNFKISGYEGLGFALESNEVVGVINNVANTSIGVG